MSESDGIEEAFEGTARVALTAAGQLGEQLARLREEQLGRARARSQEQGRQYALRLHAERDAARAQLAPVGHVQWWATASPQDVVQAYTTARSWEHVDPQAAQAAARIRAAARERYGVDLDVTAVDTAGMDEAFARGQALERQAMAERQLERADLAQAQALIAQADRAERAAGESRTGDGAGVDDVLAAIGLDVVSGGGSGDRGTLDEREQGAARAHAGAAAAYDSAERRAAFAAELESRGIDHDLVAVRLRADVSNAKPATEATRTTTRAAHADAEQPAAARRRRALRSRTR
ncbi:hypothetical protein ICW40_18125 [Actinotalea ferrariae]|uniref:hypothetical protein n=1 Tax=Actinotalea ferrariae TaxID=1386098 RepID=UPI001C8CA96C|nr:hypothetical protein [Actinotalea ferrariae]MBX9246710.1 hypothetical protein [Actinotalea ferrariae]